MEEVAAKMGTGGMPREQWEHGDKGAEDERKGEDTLVLVERETYMKEKGVWPSQKQQQH